MANRKDDLRDCLTAYECRDRLPELSAWMDDDSLKLIPIWKGPRFEHNKIYFDLDNPERGSFIAAGDEAPPTDWTYVCRDDVPEQVWARLVTWRQPVSADQAEAIEATVETLGVGRDQSAAGEARPLPPG